MLDVRLQQLAVAICIGFSLTVWWGEIVGKGLSIQPHC
jgi:hypothetical protein